MLQVVMGWTDSHLHSFHIGERGYTNSEDFADLNMLAETGHSLGASVLPVRGFESP